MSGVESLESVQLADWLDKQLKQRRLELKDRERQTLIDEEINGAAFVLLSEDDLKDLGFKMGARRVILEIINSTQQAEDHRSQYNGVIEVENDHTFSNPANNVPMGVHRKPPGGRIMADYDEPVVEVPHPEVVQNKYTRTDVTERTITRPSSPPLEMKHSFDISQALKNLTDDDIIQVGKALGLNGVKLQRKRTLPSDMVDCWLRQEDNVIVTSGDPTRSSLADALEMIGHEGTANKVRELQVYNRGTRRNGGYLATSFSQAPPRSPSKPGLADQPTIGQLHQFPGTRLKVINSVAPRWKQFGLFLDFDEQGNTLDMIEAEKRTHFDCCTEMFKRWLKGEGLQPVSWSQVISLLQENGQRNLASDLERALRG